MARPARSRRSSVRSPREVAREAFRAGICEAAEQVFEERGVRAAKMTDIARVSGVAVGTLYNYFQSKEEIFAEVAARRTADFFAALEPALQSESPSERMRAVVRAAFDYLDRHGAFFALFVELGAVAEWDIARVAGERTDANYERFIALLERTVGEAVAAGELRDDVPPRAIAAALSGAMNAATYSWIKARRRTPLTAAADDMLTLFFAGARR